VKIDGVCVIADFAADLSEWRAKNIFAPFRDEASIFSQTKKCTES